MKFPFQGWNLMAIVPTLQAEPLSVSPPNDHRNLFCATIEGSISPRGMLSTLPRTTLLSSRRNQFQQGPPQPQSLVNPVPEQAAPKYEPPEGYLLFFVGYLLLFGQEGFDFVLWTKYYKYFTFSKCDPRFFFRPFGKRFNLDLVGVSVSVFFSGVKNWTKFPEGHPAWGRLLRPRTPRKVFRSKFMWNGKLI